MGYARAGSNPADCEMFLHTEMMPNDAFWMNPKKT